MTVLRSFLLVATLAAVTLAPSLFLPTPVGSVAAEAMIGSIPWSLEDCQVVLATWNHPGHLVQDQLPDGFIASTVVTTGGPTVTQFGFEMDDCASGAGAEGSVAPMQYATVWAQVQAPAHLRVLGAGGHYLTFGSLVPDAPRRELLHANGLLDVYDGAISIERVSLAAGLEAVRAVSTFENGDVVTILTQTDALRPGLSPGGSFVSFTVTGENVSRWRTDWASRDGRSAPGVVQFSPGSRAAEIFGVDAIPSSVSVTNWDYTGGMIEFPLPLHRP